LAAFAVSALTPLAAFAALVNGTGNVTPNVIFGTGNVNGSFTGATAGNVELALRAKLRYCSTPDIGFPTVTGCGMFVR
jgi:hypothetical protein